MTTPPASQSRRIRPVARTHLGQSDHGRPVSSRFRNQTSSDSQQRQRI